jgi:site-specific recombinase XerD
MNGTPHNDEMARTLKRFVDWAREQGWLYHMVPSHLRHLQHFLQGRGVHQLTEVHALLLADYQRDLSMQRSAATVQGYLTTLRALWRYLLKEELTVEDATRGLKSVRVDTFVPHIYTTSELSCIERATRAAMAQAHHPGPRFLRQTQHAVFGLLRDCGLRVSEACRLDMNHYDPRSRTLRIEYTKFFKTRHIPLPRSTCTLLDTYVQHRHKLSASTTVSPALFVSAYGRRLGRVALEARFKQLLCELGLYQPRLPHGRTVLGSTNLHALRHSFAVRTLERWQCQGDDVEHLLPLLSAYLGHVNVRYTKHYLHLTPTLRRLASERFAQLALPHIDRLGVPRDDE